MAIEFDLLENGLSETLGDELNAMFTALKNGVNIALQWRGAWNSATQYDSQDVVSHAGGKWLALQTTTNSAPTEGANWTALGGGGSGTIEDDSITLQKLAPAVRTKFDERPTLGEIETLIEDAGGAAIEAGANITITDLPSGAKQIAATGALSGTFTAQTRVVTTTNLAPGAAQEFQITLAKTAKLALCQTSGAAWVRLYPSLAAKSADSNRLQNEWFESDDLVFDFLSRDGDLDTLLEAVDAFSLESPRTNSFPLVVQNAAAIPQTITVTLTYFALEI